MQELQRLLSERIETARQGVGIVAGIITPGVTRFFAHGRAVAGGAETVGPDTVFETGSITKIFTAQLLADMVAKGEVALGDPVAAYLPAPCPGSITLLQLATHASGLPPMPPHIRTLEDEAAFGAEQLYALLARVSLGGKKYAYSNLGYGLLAHALSLRAGMDYAALLRTRIFAPLGMENSATNMAGAIRRATGHSAALQPVSDLKLDALAGSGALCSTARDLLQFLGVHLRRPPSPARAAMRENRRPAAGNTTVALGWHINKSARGSDIFWHNGGTMGFQSYFGFAPDIQTGVVVLGNATTRQRIDGIGFDVLNRAEP